MSSLTKTVRALLSVGKINDFLVYRNCTWRIQAPMGNSVNLTFSHFEMEDHYGTGNCSFDFLSVTEGDGSTELGKFCGLSVPERISSSSESVLVHFQSDYSVAHNGFRLGSEVFVS